MSVRVNLIPREVEQRNVVRRQQAIAGVAVLAFLVLLAVLYFVQVGRVNDAQEELAAQETIRDELRAEVNELAAYADLEARADALAALIASAMAEEISPAGLLQDIAAVLPSDVELQSVAANVVEPTAAEAAPDATAAPILRPIVGTMTLSGQTLDGHAPGLERVLIALEKIAGFENVLFSLSTLDDEDVATFTVTIDLGPELLTGRYLDGIPEGLR